MKIVFRLGLALLRYCQDDLVSMQCRVWSDYHVVITKLIILLLLVIMKHDFGSRTRLRAWRCENKTAPESVRVFRFWAGTRD